MAAIGTDISEIIAINTAKLKHRYPSGRFDRDASINRDTDKENKIMKAIEKGKTCYGCTDAVCTSLSTHPRCSRYCTD